MTSSEKIANLLELSISEGIAMSKVVKVEEIYNQNCPKRTILISKNDYFLTK